jgi:Sigma-70, region 4.
MQANYWLDDRERMVFDFFYRRGWHIEDIAAELDYSRSTITRVLKSMRTKLKK